MLKISLSQLTLSTASFTLYTCVFACPVLAQIIPDNSLGNESSVVTPNVTVKDTIADLIEGGAVRDNNLFHSFEQFNISEGSNVYFANPDGIANILTRITGNNISEIFGTLGIDGTANLFLLNPNGIVFGENSALDVSGSFLATTADSYIFENGFNYSASVLDIPPLLTIDLPLGVQMGNNPRDILVRGTGHNLSLNNSFISIPIRGDRPAGLQVKSGNTLALISGEINLTGGNLTAENGRVELGGVREAKIIDFNPTDDGFNLDYGEISNFGDINLTQAASIEVSGTGGGNVEVRGDNISVVENSTIIANTLSTDNGGNVSLTASESVKVISTEGELFPSSIFAQVEAGATGNGGNLTIDAQDFETTGLISTSTFGSGKGGNITIESDRMLLQDGGQIGSGTFGEGDSGDLTVDAESIEIKGTTPQGLPSGLFSTVNSLSATGKGGNITVSSDLIILQNGGQISSGTFGAGDSGDLTVDAESIEIRGTAPQGLPSGLLSTVAFPSATGKGGNITVSSDLIILEDGGQIGSGTFGAGDSGDLTVDAESIEIRGTAPQGFSSGLFSTVAFPSATGKGGSLSVNSDRIILEDGGQISSGTFGAGDSGNLSIDSDRIILENGGQIGSGTFGAGNSGNLSIKASDSIKINGVNSSTNLEGENIIFSSGLFASVESGATGNGGNVAVETGDLSISQGGKIVTNTSGQGDAGNININAHNLEIEDTVIDRFGARSGINSTVELQGIGNGGNLEILTSNLRLIDGGSIAVDTFGQGDAGNININAQNINISGVSSDEPILGFEQESLPSQISAFSQGDFAAGSISIASKNINLSDRGNISVSNSGNGNSGNLNITANELNLDRSGIIEAQVNAGNQGNINLTTDNITLNNQSQITVEATDTATGGNITIDNSKLILARNNSDIKASAVFGSGGNINISTELILTDLTSDIDASSEFGLDGVVEIKSPESEKELGEVVLSEEIEDPTSLIAALCPSSEDNTLATTGNGGIPSSPYQTQSLNTTWYDLRPVERKTNEIASLPKPITEATTTMIDANGELELVALTPLSTHRWVKSSCSN